MIVAIDAVFGGGGALLGAGFVLGEVCTVLFISEASPRASVSPAFVHSSIFWLMYLVSLYVQNSAVFSKFILQGPKPTWRMKIPKRFMRSGHIPVFFSLILLKRLDVKMAALTVEVHKMSPPSIIYISGHELT
jgi:hypothetical protein